MSNAAYHIDETWDEMLGGKIVAMSPRPTVNHNEICGNIFYIFKSFLKGKNCKSFSDGVDLFLNPTDRFVPDGMIVCNRDIIKADGIHGTPDLVIEVLSPSTAKNDRSYKKDAYEKAGVKEYWIVDPANKTVEDYLLINEQFELDSVYVELPDYVIAKMNDAERAEIVTEFKCSLYSDLTISVAEIFEGMI